MALKSKQNRTIFLSFTEQTYASFMEDNGIAHKILKENISHYPELFPEEIKSGYMLNGYSRYSKKLGHRLRKIKVSGVSYRIRPSYILPYNRAKVEEVSKPLFLLRFNVPFWALAHVFGRNPMWWYRLYMCLGEYSIVGTTVRHAEALPKNLLADEHHVRVSGKKAYVATTVGSNCFLGMSVSAKADETALVESYGVFKEEAIDLSPDYQPSSVNTDGWWATQNAWKNLFAHIAVIECFLHAFLKVRDRATKKLKAFFDVAADRIWECYRAESKRSLAQQIRHLKQWAEQQMPDCPMKNNILKLCKKKKRWMAHFDHPEAHQTSNMIDRLMRAMKKHAFNSQMFHSTIPNTSRNFRAFALLYNCLLYTSPSPRDLSTSRMPSSA